MMDKASGQKKPNRAVLVIRFLIKTLYHNWPFKLLSLLIAVSLWGFLIASDPSVTRERRFTNVTVSATGADTLKHNGLIVVSDISNLQLDAMNVDVPQKQYATVSASMFSPRVDLSRIKTTGQVPVSVVTSTSSTYGTVTKTEPDQMMVEVEEYVTRYRIPVSVDRFNEPPEGFALASLNVDPAYVTVSGPASMVRPIARAKVNVDLNKLTPREQKEQTLFPFELQDAEGNPVPLYGESGALLVEVTSDSVLLDAVSIEHRLYSARTFPVTEEQFVIGAPAAGYEVRGVHLSTDSYTAYGRKAVLDELEGLIASNTIDIAGADKSVSRTIHLQTTDGVEAVKPSTISVQIEIGAIQGEHVFPARTVALTGVNNASFAYDYAVRKADVTIAGDKLVVDAIKADDVRLVLDVSQCVEGEFDVPVKCYHKGEEIEATVSPETIRVKVKKK